MATRFILRRDDSRPRELTERLDALTVSKSSRTVEGNSMVFAPKIEGDAAIRSPGAQFVAAFRERVARGLLLDRPHPRSRYSVAESEPDRLRVIAADWWTAISVGLNDVQLRLDRPGSVHYSVRYWRWATYALGLSGLLGLIGVVMLLTLDARGYLARHSDSMMPGLSVGQNLAMAWLMVGFWGFVWPWLLIGLHKRPLHQQVRRIIADVDAAAGGR